LNSNFKRYILGENEILRLMYELGETMEYLQYNKILHKNLSTHTVRIKRQNSAYTIKLSVFGPTLYHIGNDGSRNMIDEERWQAPEVMRFQKYSHASDVYSFALVLWEMCCLGATVYGSLATSDLFVRIKKGLRPDKYPFISEDLYQLMLNCWELDPHERSEISDVSGHLRQFQSAPHHYLNFQHEKQLPFYLPLLEIKN
jgi:endothelial-specific receptor tyrosine kinase